MMAAGNSKMFGYARVSSRDQNEARQLKDCSTTESASGISS